MGEVLVLVKREGPESGMRKFLTRHHGIQKVMSKKPNLYPLLLSHSDELNTTSHSEAHWAIYQSLLHKVQNVWKVQIHNDIWCIFVMSQKSQHCSATKMLIIILKLQFFWNIWLPKYLCVILRDLYYIRQKVNGIFYYENFFGCRYIKSDFYASQFLGPALFTSPEVRTLFAKNWLKETHFNAFYPC